MLSCVDIVVDIRAGNSRSIAESLHHTFHLMSVLANFLRMHLSVASEVNICLVCFTLLWPPYGIWQAIIFLPVISSSIFFFSSPILSRRWLDVCHTATHGVALVRIQDAGLKCAALGSLKIQDAKKSPKIHHLRTITRLCRAISSQLKHLSTIGKNLLNSNIFPTCPHNMVNFFPPTSGWDWFVSLGHPSKFQWFSRLGFVTAATSHNGSQPNFARCLAISWAGTFYIHFRGLLPRYGILPGAKFSLHPSLALSNIGSVTAWHSSSGHQPNFATLSRGRHLYSAGQPSRWTLAHIVVLLIFKYSILIWLLYKMCEHVSYSW